MTSIHQFVFKVFQLLSRVVFKLFYHIFTLIFDKNFPLKPGQENGYFLLYILQVFVVGYVDMTTYFRRNRSRKIELFIEADSL